MAERRRLDDLRRRVREDPASILFAQLAEELRRAGRLHEAVGVGRAGLAVHVGYVSARVTLGRALAALGADDDARRELEVVLATAPENLAALRTMADLHRRRGELAEALRCYRVALDLSSGDFELEQTVRDLTADLSRASGATSARRAQSAKRERALRTIARLEQWLSAIHGTRTVRHA
jgi:tetratricopeptide (TPR) repeat protein